MIFYQTKDMLGHLILEMEGTWFLLPGFISLVVVVVAVLLRYFWAAAIAGFVSCLTVNAIVFGVLIHGVLPGERLLPWEGAFSLNFAAVGLCILAMLLMKGTDKEMEGDRD